MGRSGPCSFEEEGFKAWQELCMEVGREAHPGQAAQGKRHRLWVAVAWAVGAEVRGQQGQSRELEEARGSAAGPRAEAVCPLPCCSLAGVCSLSPTVHRGKVSRPHGKLRALGTYSDKQKTWPSPPNVSS